MPMPTPARMKAAACGAARRRTPRSIKASFRPVHVPWLTSLAGRRSSRPSIRPPGRAEADKASARIAKQSDPSPPNAFGGFLLAVFFYKAGVFSPQADRISATAPPPAEHLATLHVER